MRKSRLLLFLACLGPLGAGAHEFRLQAAASWVENISRTSFEPTAKNAAVFTADGAFSHVNPFAPGWTAILSAEGGIEHVPEFRPLDRASLGLRGTLRKKFGLGPLAPVAEAGLALGRTEFNESGRSGWRSEGTLSLGKRITETWRVTASASWESYSAVRAPFDTHQRRLGLETAWDVTDRWRLGAGGSRLHGQLTANAAWFVWSQAISGGFGPVVNTYYNSIPWAVTDTFGPGWVAYRVDCRADFLWGETSFAWSDDTRITLRRESVKVINRIGIRYDSEIWSLGFVHRF